MKKLITILSSLTFAAVASFLFSSCSSTTATTGNVPTGVQARTLSPTSIEVYWTRDPSDASNDTVLINGVAATPSVPSPIDSEAISGLTAGVTYSIVIGTSAGRSTSIPYTISVGAPTGLMALSEDAITISIEWTRGANDVGADTIILTSSAGTSSSTVGAGISQALLGNLTTGTVYTITVASTGGRSSSLNWMTAIRTTGLQLYQFSSSGMSGLVLNGPDSHAEVVSASSANSDEMDFFLDDLQHASGITTPSGLSFEGAQFLNAPGSSTPYRASFMDPTARYIVGGLNSDYSATDFSTQIADSINNTSVQTPNYDIPADAIYNTKGSRVLLVETADGNFAKIEIQPDPTTGLLYSGSGTDQYITVNVSYQPTTNQPYAGRGHHRFSSFPVRHSAQ